MSISLSLLQFMDKFLVGHNIVYDGCEVRQARPDEVDLPIVPWLSNFAISDWSVENIDSYKARITVDNVDIHFESWEYVDERGGSDASYCIATPEKEFSGRVSVQSLARYNRFRSLYILALSTYALSFGCSGEDCNCYIGDFLFQSKVFIWGIFIILLNQDYTFRAMCLGEYTLIDGEIGIRIHEVFYIRDIEITKLYILYGQGRV